MRYKENCVYAVQTPKGIKIGLTSRLGDRLRAFQSKHETACYPISLITGLTRMEAMKIEIAIHEKLSHNAIGGEYFSVLKPAAKRVFDDHRGFHL